ncbi:NACHT domain-containing protein [Rhizomonospora bruguierae]|uniref:NACHT domain-containing protein n=1 Tax=Rhizomonospora bruguierae TaxID=1581705 RepID=UPI001BCC7D84|nr:ATP-binding protein [Micromonospora sp. NBRC 107566]
MPHGLSYADAVRILGGSGPLAKAAENLLGGALTVATAGGSELAISLFDAKAEVVRLGGLVTARIGDSVRGLGRHDRSERLQAAHVVLVVTAFFTELDDCLTAAGIGKPGFTRDDQLRFAAGGDGGTLVDRLLPAPVPLPAPDLPYASLLADMKNWFAEEAARMGRHLAGLAVWDRAGERARGTLTDLLDQRLPGAAVARYDEIHRRLCAQIPEFALWADRLEARATARGLERLEELLLQAASDGDPSRHRAALARACRAELDRPVLSGDAGELRLPTLGAGYIDPHFRVKAAGPGAHPADDRWWTGAAVRADFAGFLAAHLTTTRATEAPMLLLGQPGAGKSSLTRILAARLPPGDFFVCRVPLREVPAEAEIQDQVEGALRGAIGETVSWAELSRDAGGALPVILLDGFDELLQVTGLHQSDYLERVAKFQQREAALGRPVAVMVTSRIAVADRTRLPVGALAVRLEPFDDAQIERWLTVWNGTTAPVKPLAPDVVLRFRALAEQPLLLLMLALYDATGHALQDGAAALNGGQLYERLLASFTEREVRRVHAGQPDSAVPPLVEQELLRLSVVAFAMFHRMRLWVTERELDDDLDGLGITASRPGGTEGFRSPLTAGQEMVGRFFFIQRAQAVQEDEPRQTYEFLHATFGEYLVARLVVQAVRDTEARAAASTLALRLGLSNDDDLLRSLLGFTPLTARATVLPFIAGLLDGPDRDCIRGWLTGRTAQAVTRPQYTESRYRPVAKRIDHWLATYSFNLLMLTLACGGELRASDLFTRAGDPAAWLRNSALQWQAAIPGDMWMDAMEVLTVTRGWRDGRRDIVLEYAREWTADLPDPTDVYWINGLEAGGSRDVAFAATFEIPPALRSMQLSNRLSDDALLHALEPLIHRIPAALTQFATRENGHSSVAHSLIRMWLAVPRRLSSKELVAAYEEVSNAAVDLANGKLVTASGEVTELLLHTMRADAYRLPGDKVCAIVHELIDEAVLTPVAAASAVYCLAASDAAAGRYGAGLASDLIREHADGIDVRALIPALRALVDGQKTEPVDLDRLVAALIEAGRRPELERAAPGLAESLFGGV